MVNTKKRVVILNEVELRKTLSRLTYEIIEKVKNLDNLLLVGIPTRGINLAEVLEKELFSKTGSKIKKGIISHLKINVPTYKKNKIPKNLKLIPIITPGSRFIK